MMFKPVEPMPNFPQIEEKILAFWKKNKIFNKSVAKKAPHGDWTFLDGPPFITGTPHYGTLLSSLPKDLFGRYWTMKGYRVRRRWGWDGHGLPIENKVEAALKIKRKKDIEEKIGVKKFIEECRKYIEIVSSEWEWYVDHIGRWVDFKNAYKTWNLTYMESVMWVFKKMYDKGYIYKGLRVSLFCPHCSTPISNFEVAMDAENYKDIKEAATIYKYQLKDEKDTYFLAWSTTPWNKIVTPALAVNPKLQYVKVKQADAYYILAKSAIKNLNKEPKTKVIEEFAGQKLIGKQFIPHYDFYKIDPTKKAFVVVGGDFVTADEGTGIVTLAVYGEEDLNIMQKEGIQLVFHVDDEGIIRKDVPLFGGMFYLDANKAVDKNLQQRNLLYRQDKYIHSVAHCWRCETRLFFNPQDAWYVNVQTLKNRLKTNNEAINWVPKHFKYGRFLKSLENAPDWNISRSRYWGSPVPVWECVCGERFVPGSLGQLEAASGKKINDLHKPDIDDVTVRCKKCGKQAKRVPEVLDSWIEAGSASFAERHFPFNKQYKLEDFFPPDFIAEYTGQIRAWFYVLHVIGTALYDSPAFKSVLVEGVILGTDGRKMSKNYGNYPDPKMMLQKYGGDGLRLYLLGSPVMRGEDILISEEQYRNQVKGMLLFLWNVYRFFVNNAVVDKWKINRKKDQCENILDAWAISLLNRTIQDVTHDLDSFDTVKAVAHLNDFVQNLSTWFIRRSRDRVGPSASDQKDKDNFYSTCHLVLVTLTKLLAPIVPFTVEEIYKNIKEHESVHLDDWPRVDKKSIDLDLEQQMAQARQVVEIAHAQRKKAQIKLRQPLNSLIATTPISIWKAVNKIIAAEVNVKKVINKTGKTLAIKLETKLTAQLKAEGEARAIVRMIQVERKKLETRLDERIDVYLEQWPAEFENEIKRRALVNRLVRSKEFKVVRK